MAYTDQEIQDRASKLVAAGTSPDVVRQFINTAKAEQGGMAAQPTQATPPPQEQMLTREQLTDIGRSAAASATPQGAMIDRYGETLKSAAIQGGPAAVGQAIGAPLAPFTWGSAPFVLGGLGGLGGYLADTYRRGESPTLGGGTAATLLGAMPGAPVAQGARAIAQKAAIQGVMNMGAAQVEKALDGQGMLTGGEALTSLGGGIASDLGMRGVGKAVGAGVKTMPKTQLEMLDEARIASAREIRKRGGAIPPRELGRGNELIGSIAEQASTYQAISRKNAPIIQQMAREDLGLPGNGPIKAAPPIGSTKVKNDIQDYIAKQYEPYETARKYGYNPDELKALRIQQRATFERRQTDAGWKQAYDDLQAQIDGWESAVEKAAKAAGDDNLIPRLKDARANIARAYAYDAAIGRSSGIIDPSVLGVMIENGVPLSGNARIIGDFYNNFPKAAGDITRMPPPGSKGMGANVAWLSAAEGNASGWMAALSRSKAGEMARNYIMSDAAQNRFLAPRIDPNRAANAVSLIPLYGGQAISRNRFLWGNEEERR
jgi:hypothetical protein